MNSGASKSTVYINQARVKFVYQLATSDGNKQFLYLIGWFIISIIQYSTVQYSTVQYSTVQYSTVQYSTDLMRSLIRWKMLRATLVDYSYSSSSCYSYS